MLRRLLGLVIVVLLVGGALYYWKHRDAGARPEQALAYVGDKIEAAKTTGEVKTALSLDRNLKSYSMDVDTHADGVVRLQGAVPREELRAEAERVAAAVPSVRRVVNELRVDPTLPAPDASGRTLGENLDDRALEAKIKLAFSLNRDLKGTDLKVEAFRRQATLRGSVETPAQRQVALEIAQRTPAVAAVNDQIGIAGQAGAAPTTGNAPGPGYPTGGGTGSAPGGPMADDPTARAAAAERALRANPNLAAYGLTARAQPDGSLVVSGRVRTGAERDLAVMVAREAAGRPVQSALQVGQ